MLFQTSVFIAYVKKTSTIIRFEMYAIASRSLEFGAANSVVFMSEWKMQVKTASGIFG